MIPGDGGGRRPSRQAPSPGWQRLCPHINGEKVRADTRRSPTNRRLLDFLDRNVTAITAGACSIVYRVLLGAVCPALI